MSRTIMIATAVVAIAVIAYLALIGTAGPRPPMADNLAATAVSDDTEAIVDENTSTRAASDAATDEAFESASEGEEPVQSNLGSSRAAADATGTVGAEAFTPEGYDPEAIVVAIENSSLDDAEKDRLRALLAEMEPADDDLEPTLARIRAALRIES